MIGKYFIETSNKVELRINSVRINRAQPVTCTNFFLIPENSILAQTDISNSLVFPKIKFCSSSIIVFGLGVLRYGKVASLTKYRYISVKEGGFVWIF